MVIQLSYTCNNIKIYNILYKIDVVNVLYKKKKKNCSPKGLTYGRKDLHVTCPSKNACAGRLHLLVAS